jgi:uncharacterized protein YjbJ (UPF0337 family)
MDTDRIEGRVKEGAGKVSGDEELEQEGAGQKNWGDAKDKARGAWDDAKDAAGDAKDALDDKDDDPS